MDDPTVLQAKRYGIYSCTENTELLKAAQQMAEEDISALVVVDSGGYLAGIITRTDLLRALLTGEDWSHEPVARWMSREVVTVSPSEHLSQVARLLINRQIHRVVAVEEERGKRRPVVVLSSADVVYHMAKNQG